MGRTTCSNCARINPPYGHLNSFDEERLGKLFPSLTRLAVEHLAENKERSNFVSVALQDFAGNPYGAYDQEEPCVFCGSKLRPPDRISLVRRAAASVGVRLYHLQLKFNKPMPTWILLLFQKPA